jgi:hypothetical protein
MMCGHYVTLVSPSQNIVLSTGGDYRDRCGVRGNGDNNGNDVHARVSVNVKQFRLSVNCDN